MVMEEHAESVTGPGEHVNVREDLSYTEASLLNDLDYGIEVRHCLSRFLPN